MDIFGRSNSSASKRQKKCKSRVSQKDRDTFFYYVYRHETICCVWFKEKHPFGSALFYLKNISPIPYKTLAGWTIDGASAFSWLIAENGLLVALCTVAVTRWMSRYSERQAFVGSSVLYGISMWLFSQTSSLLGLIAVMALFTLAELMTAGLQQSFISRLAPEAMRGQYFAAASLRFTIGRMLAPLSLVAAEWIGYAWTFVVLGMLALGSAALYAWMFQQVGRRMERPNASFSR